MCISLCACGGNKTATAVKEEVNIQEMIQQFGDVIVYFWKNRVKELFSEKEIIVELGNDLMGEFGLCITMYEKSRN